MSEGHLGHELQHGSPMIRAGLNLLSQFSIAQRSQDF
jgi:hypothetical protein